MENHSLRPHTHKWTKWRYIKVVELKETLFPCLSYFINGKLKNENG